MATYNLAFPDVAIDAILTTAYHLQQAGYIFRGSASDYSGTPTEREWVIAPAGFTGLGLSSAVPQGSIGVCLYTGTAWVGKIINVLTLDSAPTRNSQNGVTSGGVAATLDEIAGGIMATFASLLFDDETAAGDLSTKLSYAVKFSVSDVYQTVTHLNILAATSSKAGLMSAEDKAKVDSFLTGIRSMQFVDATSSSEQAIKLVEQLKWTVGGVQEVIDSITLLAATSSKAGLLSASDKAYIDALPATLTNLSNSISGALALMQSLVGYYVCDTAAGTAAKTVAATGYSLTNGGCIRIKMTNANTANNATLNINSTGAKALYYDGAQASATNTWEAGEVLEVYYDGTQYQCASGGGGKFASGESVKDVAITQEIIAGSSALPTSAAVAAVTTEAVEVHPPVSSYERVGLNVNVFVTSTTRVSLKLPMPIDKVKLTSFASGYHASVVQWNANNPSASLLDMRGTKLSDSGWLSTDTTVNILQNANFVNVTISKTNNGTITIDEAVAAVVISYAGIRPNNYFSTGERVSETGITNIITENSDELVKGGAVYPIKQAVDEHSELLSNCYHYNPSGTETKTITGDDLMNGNQYWNTNTGRIVLKKDALISVVRRLAVTLLIPYSSVSSDTNIDRASLPLYDENQNYLSSLDLGWFYFNGQNITITLDLTDSRYADVRYIGIYFGCASGTISPSSVNTSGILYTITVPAYYTTKAVDEDMLQEVQDEIDAQNEALVNCYRTIDVIDTSVGIQQSDLGNLKNNDFSAADNRINLKQDALVPASGRSKVVLTVPYSAVSADTNIVNVTMPMYNANRQYLSALNLGWYAFNGHDVIIEYDLSAHPEVAYISVYFGSVSAAISPSSINVSGIKFDFYKPQEVISPALSENQLRGEEMDWNVAVPSNVYYGDKVSLTEYGTGIAINKFAFEKIGTLSTGTGNRQGGAIYGNYLLQFHVGLASVIFFDLATKTNVQTISMTAITNFHAGSGAFSKTFYDASDPFPLLYVAGMEQKIINVYRITGTAGNFVMTKIQTITLNIPYYLPNIAIDNEHGRIVVFSYTKSSWSNPVDNYSMFFTFPIPSHDQDVTITQMDNLHKRPFIYAQQGAFAIGNILYLSYGVPSTDTGIIVYDYYNDIVKNLIGTNVIAASFEPEALGVYNSKMILTRNTGEVYQLTF